MAKVMMHFRDFDFSEAVAHGGPLRADQSQTIVNAPPTGAPNILKDDE